MVKKVFTIVICWGLAFSLGSVERREGKTAVKIDFKKIERGTFIMGSPRSEEGREDDEGPVFVEIEKPFAIMTKEVTQGQWFAVMGRNPSFFSGRKYCDNYEVRSDVGMCPDHPVESVSWYEVQEFINELNQREGNKDCDGTPGRLVQLSGPSLGEDTGQMI